MLSLYYIVINVWVISSIICFSLCYIVINLWVTSSIIFLSSYYIVINVWDISSKISFFIMLHCYQCVMFVWYILPHILSITMSYSRRLWACLDNYIILYYYIIIIFIIIIADCEPVPALPRHQRARPDPQDPQHTGHAPARGDVDVS